MQRKVLKIIAALAILIFAITIYLFNYIPQGVGNAAEQSIKAIYEVSKSMDATDRKTLDSLKRESAEKNDPNSFYAEDATLSWLCEEEPKPILTDQNYLKTTLDVPNLGLVRKEIGNTWPALDLNFIIEKDGTISRFHADNYISRLEQNEEFRDTLYEIAVSHITGNYPNWVPGKMAGRPVRTRHNLRITFIGNLPSN